MRKTREPAVAGYFYPVEEQALIRTVDSYLVAGEQSETAVAVVSPHAGYIYSGATAGKTLAGVDVPDSVIILGPKHRRGGKPQAISAADSWRFPFGQVTVHRELSERIAEETYAEFDDIPHLQEHSLEVQVPFLWRRNPSIRIVALALDFQPLSELAILGEGLAKAIRKSNESVLIVASSDMSHHIPEDEAARLDKMALAHVLKLDPEGLYRTVIQNDISMCGVVPVTVALFAALGLGATTAVLREYTSSAKVSGDRSQVVGYAGVVIR